MHIILWLGFIKIKLTVAWCVWFFHYFSFQCRGNSLTDLIHMSRACINELSQEIVDLQAKAALAEKDRFAY